MKYIEGQRAAAYLGLSVQKLRETISPVKLPSGEERWSVEDLDAWIDGFKATSAGAEDDSSKAAD